MTKPDEHLLALIGKWLIALADLTRHGEDKPTREKLGLYADMLAADFPGAAFTRSSLHAVVQGRVFFPSYEETRAALSTWWRANRPQDRTMIEDAAFAALGPEDRLGVQHWRKRRAELSVQFGGAQREAELDRLNSFVRRYYADAWRYIAQTEGLAEVEVLPAKPLPTARIAAGLAERMRGAA